MLNNWRSSLLFSKLAFHQDDNCIAAALAVPMGDIHHPWEYIVLDPIRLRGMNTTAWVKDNFAEFGFDFDKYSMLLWPDDDAVPASVVVKRINTAIPRFASIKLISPALAHGLDDIGPLSFDDGSMDIDAIVNKPDFKLYF
jgi:hypothetical protein